MHERLLRLFPALAFAVMGVMGCDKGEPAPAAPPPAAKAPAPEKPHDYDRGMVVTDPETLKRIDDLKNVQGEVPVPDAIANTPVAKEFTRHAAPIFKDYGADKFAIVAVMEVGNSDTMAMARLIEAFKRYQLAGSTPAVQTDRKTRNMNLFAGVGPVKDLEKVAKWLTDAGVGTDAKVDVEKRTITLIAPKDPSQP